MYILLLDNDFGYDGQDLYRIAVSSEKGKLEDLKDIIKSDLICRTEMLDKLAVDMDIKWKDKRENPNRRTTEEMEDYKCLESSIRNSFELLTKYKLDYVVYYERNSTFRIEEIEEI